MTIVFPRVVDVDGDDIIFGDNAIFFEANRKLTEAYISENPVEIILQPHTRTRTDTGGYTYATPAPRDAQTVRIIETSSIAVTDPQRTETGFQRVRTYQLMARYDAIMAIDDTFVLDGVTWVIISFMPKNGYERRAVVDRVGA